MESEIKFKKGEYKLNDDPNYNFQFNRVIMWDGGRLEDVEKVSRSIKTSDDWKKTLIALGEQAENEGRTENAVAYYRMSEFFMYDGDPDKIAYYKKATDMFYDFYSDYFNDGTIERLQAPYEGVKLPVMHFKAKGEKKDTILFHGGNDSYFEELFFPALYFAERGFEVYLFEGPGQGGVMRCQGMPFTYQWERPVTAICDAFNLEDITIIGVSLGGMLAPRAAAFEPRIKRVVGWSVFPSYLHVVLADHCSAMRSFIYWLIKHKCRVPLNAFLKMMMKKEPVADWAVRHGMYAYGAKDPFGYLEKLEQFQMLDIGEKITQDMLILGAEKDHFIMNYLYKEEIDALPNVKSLTYRCFTAREDGASHCSVGNTKLVLDTIAAWIELIKLGG